MTEEQAERIAIAIEDMEASLSRLTGMLVALYNPDPTWVERARRDRYRKYAAEES